MENKVSKLLLPAILVLEVSRISIGLFIGMADYHIKEAHF